jgi:hypothetical protein
MSTITFTPAVAQAAMAETARPQAGLLERIFASIIEARERQAVHTVAVQLAGLSSERLAGLGLTNAEIAAIRTGEPVGHVLGRRRWSNAA